MSNVTILLLSHVEELARGASRLLSEANAEVEVMAVGGSKMEKLAQVLTASHR
ncbi:hypothetical protein [Geomicrobium sp. JCM 19037]|uniref:hypothetical protein n=1 Tax=Geomicrobium sp. JCM 19037 TaxID=1460634 RepID=UPI001EE643AA|nr:hypothetical protein [Geomicrobium sp. JCM 19037]